MLALGGGEGYEVEERFGERLGAYLDPGSAVEGVEVLPWSADGGYYRSSACESLYDSEPKIFGFCGEDEDVCLLEELPFFLAIDTGGKTKGVFPNDDAVFKLVWLAFRNIKKKWNKPTSNWGQTVQQLALAFGERFRIL